MDWATVFVVFVVVFAVFTTQTPEAPRKVKASKPNITALAKKPVMETTSLKEIEHNISTANITDLNHYQTIVSYIMDNYKKIYLSDVLAIAQNIIDYGIEFNVDPLLVTALISVESGFNKKAVSKTGAKGLGQIKSFNFKRYSITHPFDIKQNVRATTALLRDLLKRWDGKTSYALASYYQGPTAIINNHPKPFRKDTQQYVNKIIARYNHLKKYK